MIVFKVLLRLEILNLNNPVVNNLDICSIEYILNKQSSENKWIHQNNYNKYRGGGFGVDTAILLSGKLK